MTLETGPSSSESGLSQRDRQLDLLRVVCCVAWADGDVSADEKRLLEKLVAKYFACGDGSGANQEAARQLAAWTVDSSVLVEVIPRLTSEEDRALALKLSYMMAKVGQRPQDSSPINPAEKALYRQLVEALGLSESEVAETEWAAEQELSSGKGVWAALGAAFAGLGAWPSQEMLETPGMQWL
jgi:uncharacterized tellurite resistance protein B-like protein